MRNKQRTRMGKLFYVLLWSVFLCLSLVLGWIVFQKIGTAMHNSNNEWNLILINKDHKMPVYYKPDMVRVTETQQYVDKRIAGELTRMLDDARKDGISLAVLQGYRSPLRSDQLYNDRVEELTSQGMTKKQARQEASLWVAMPYESEHNAGIAVDIVTHAYYNGTWDALEASGTLDVQPEFVWLQEHAAEYGFILRYPEDKTEITKTGYEPWHYRYVGKEHAQYMVRNGLCLEEYLAQLSSSL